jgi:hypothetical protein
VFDSPPGVSLFMGLRVGLGLGGSRSEDEVMVGIRSGVSRLGSNRLGV